MDESAIKGLEGLESNGSDARVVRNSSIIRRMVVKGHETSPPTPREVVEEARRKYLAAAAAMDESAIKGLECDARVVGNSSIGRMVAKGDDLFPPTPRQVVEEALRKHFASRGIKLIHATVPEDDDTDNLCSHGLIYVNEECEAEALKLDGSEMGGGRILEIAAYPFGDNHLDHVFALTKANDQCLQRTLKIGFENCLASISKDDIREMVRGLFPSCCGCCVISPGCVFLYLCGQDDIDNALKLSGVSVRGFKIAVDMVLPIVRVPVGVSPAMWLPPAQGNKKDVNGYGY